MRHCVCVPENTIRRRETFVHATNRRGQNAILGDYCRLKFAQCGAEVDGEGFAVVVAFDREKFKH